MTELRLIRGADVVATVTDDEAQVIKRLCPGVTTVVLPTVHPPDTQRIVGFEARAGLLFIGSFLHQPNVDAMKYFVKDVLPLISRAIDATLTIVGPAAPPEIQGLASSEVRVLGYVADADPLFRSSRVFVSPLRYGAGMKGKNGQALSFGLPVVTTSVGAEGMHLVDGQHALIRDDPAGFAGAVVDLYTTPALWSTLSSEGLLMVEEQWSPEAMRRRLRGLVTDAPRLAPNRREPTSRIGPIPR